MESKIPDKVSVCWHFGPLFGGGFFLAAFCPFQAASGRLFLCKTKRMASLVEQRFVEGVLDSEGTRLLKNQEAAFAARLHFHTGKIATERRAEVSSGEEMSGVLSITHMVYQRFLDMKRLKYGSKEVRRNRRIYNRGVWAHFNSIAYRLANDFTAATAARIRASLNTDQ